MFSRFLKTSLADGVTMPKESAMKKCKIGQFRIFLLQKGSCYRGDVICYKARCCKRYPDESTTILKMVVIGRLRARLVKNGADYLLFQKKGCKPF